MFTRKTVFIIGAGASSEVGLPIGNEFKVALAEKLNIYFEPFSPIPKSGDALIAEALREYVKSAKLDRNTDEYLATARAISRGLPTDPSIDTYLDKHRTDKKVELCGKLAITKCILEGESKSKLYYDLQSQEKLNFPKLEKTWYNGFWYLLSTGISTSEVDKLFDNVSFIVFNYDRCLEFFLLEIIQNTYKVDKSKALDLLRKANIFHPYGTVGNLPGLERAHQYTAPFGATLNRSSDLWNFSQQIKTYTERVDEGDELEGMREAIQYADTVVFLGFAYHEQNMKLIKPKISTTLRRVIGTAKGISSADCVFVKDLLVKTLGDQVDNRFLVLSPIDCVTFIAEYPRSLTS